MAQPNFLFLMTDHQQAATVRSDLCHTPNFDRISADGVRFDRCYTVNAICSPTRASLFTGVHVHSHGMYDCTHTVDDARARYRTELPTWSGALADAGYHCAYFGKWHVERSEDLSQFGWRHQMLRTDDRAWRERYGFGPRPEPTLARSLGGRGYADRVIYGVVDEPGEAMRPAQVYGHALEYFEQQMQGDEPWCLFISLPEPHDPYICPREYYEMYDPADIPRPESFDDGLAGKPNILKRMQAVFDELTWDEFAQATACYLGINTLIDAQVGKALDALERSGQMDNTVIVCLTDHADMMGAHRLLTKGITPYEEVYNVPLIIRDPNGTRGAVCDHIVSIGDVCPTVLDLAGQESFEPCHFRSLTPLLANPAREDWTDEAYAEFHGQRFFFSQRIYWRDRLKYVLNAYDFDEMYDLQRDPHELRNVVDDPEYAEAKEQMLKGIWRQIHASGDATLANSHYWSLRVFDLGPDSVDHSTPKGKQHDR